MGVCGGQSAGATGSGRLGVIICGGNGKVIAKTATMRAVGVDP